METYETKIKGKKGAPAWLKDQTVKVRRFVSFDEAAQSYGSPEKALARLNAKARTEQLDAYTAAAMRKENPADQDAAQAVVDAFDFSKIQERKRGDGKPKERKVIKIAAVEEGFKALALAQNMPRKAIEDAVTRGLISRTTADAIYQEKENGKR